MRFHLHIKIFLFRNLKAAIAYFDATLSRFDIHASLSLGSIKTGTSPSITPDNLVTSLNSSFCGLVPQLEFPTYIALGLWENSCNK